MGKPLQVSEDFFDELDEGWWESVLADEEKEIPLPRRKPVEQPRVSNWQQARRLFLLDEVVELTVTGYNRGGLLVDGDGLMGFVPYSHLVSVTVPNEPKQRDAVLRRLIGRRLQLKVIECLPDDNRVVFSERAAQAGPGRRQILFSMLEPGQEVSGVVTNLTDFGAFVDLGGVEGLIHVSELSWGRVSHPRDVVQIGKKVRVLVLSLSAERCRVALSLKRLQPNPWEELAASCQVGDVLPVEVTELLPYGAFARLQSGVEGLIHVSQVPLQPGQRLVDVLQVGKRYQARIINLEPERQRLGLSLLVEGGNHE